MDRPADENNPAIIEHAEHPRNIGRLGAPDGVGLAGGGSCTDTLRIEIAVADDHIVDIRFECQGCPAAIACGSITTVLAKGMHLDEAAEIADETIAAALGGLSSEKRHTSQLAAEALANAIWDYVIRSVERHGR